MADGFSGNSLAQALVTLAGAITHNQSWQGIRNAGETLAHKLAFCQLLMLLQLLQGPPEPRVKIKIPAVHHLVEGIAS